MPLAVTYVLELWSIKLLINLTVIYWDLVTKGTVDEHSLAI